MENSKRYGGRVQLNRLKNGDISYYACYKLGNKKHRTRIGKKSEGITESNVIERRNTILSEARHGIDLSKKGYKYLTFDALASAYFNSREAHNSSNRASRQMYKNHIQPSFGDLTIARLDDSLVNELQELKISDGLKKGTVDIIVKLIRRISNYGVDSKLIPFKPFVNIKLFHNYNSRQRYLTNEEIKQLLAFVSDDTQLNLFVRLALGTGARKTSILAIRKMDINFETQTIILNDFKRDNKYTSKLNEKLFKLIVKHSKNLANHQHVINENGKPMSSSKVYRKLSQIFEYFNNGLDKKDAANRVVIHTLRHTFASHLAIADVSIQKIQKLMNHKDIKQTEKYAKLSSDSGMEYVENLYESVS